MLKVSSVGGPKELLQASKIFVRKCEVTFTSSEQHMEMKEARFKRDTRDSNKLITHYHFPYLLPTGVVRKSTVTWPGRLEFSQLILK